MFNVDNRGSVLTNGRSTAFWCQTHCPGVSNLWENVFLSKHFVSKKIRTKCMYVLKTCDNKLSPQRVGPAFPRWSRSDDDGLMNSGVRAHWSRSVRWFCRDLENNPFIKFLVSTLVGKSVWKAYHCHNLPINEFGLNGCECSSVSFFFVKRNR